MADLPTTQDLRDEIRKRNPRSEALYQRALQVYPRGKTGGGAPFDPFPFYASRAEGAYIWDVDAHRYIDVAMGYGLHILGHNPAPVMRALRDQMERGLHYAAPHPLEVEFAEKLSNTSQCAEKLILCNSGSEAILRCITIARAVTRKNKIAKFEGGFHGSHDYSLWSVSFTPDTMGPIEAPSKVAWTAGMARGIEDSIVMLPFHDDHAFRLIEEHADDLALVMIEPMLVAYGLSVDADFLARLREVTARCGVLLMFDEVVTRYRLALGGGEEVYGIVPDLIAMGKAIGGGMPIGAVGCKASLIDPLMHGVETVDLSSTFSGNPITVAAGLAILNHLVEDEDLYKHLYAKGAHVRSEFNAFAFKNGYPASMTGESSAFRVHFVEAPITKPRDVVNESPKLVKDFGLLMRLSDVFIPSPLRMCYLAAAHTWADIELIVKAHQEALVACMEMNRMRLW